MLRLAMRGKFDACRVSQKYAKRIDELWSKVNPKRDPNYMAKVLTDVRSAIGSMDELIAQALVTAKKPRKKRKRAP